MTPRDRILRAARRLHAREGLAGLSIRRVAAVVGLTPMALYRHFADKDALLDALVADGFGQFEAYVARAAEEPTPPAKLRALCVGYVDFALSRPHTFELMFLVPRDRVPAAPGSLQATPSDSFARIIEAVHDGMKRGDFASDDPSRVILFAWSTIHGLITLHFSGRFQRDDAVFRAVVTDQVDRLLRLLAGSSTSNR